jgi:hypothetical protein
MARVAGPGGPAEQEANMSEGVQGGSFDLAEQEIERRQTGLRIALTLLYVLIAAVLDSVLGVIVIFQLLWSLLTRTPPSRPVRDLANRIVAYYYRIGRYLTYNDSRPPFPFSEFPDVLEPGRWQTAERESDALGLPDWDEPERMRDREEP